MNTKNVKVEIVDPYTVPKLDKHLLFIYSDNGWTTLLIWNTRIPPDVCIDHAHGRPWRLVHVVEEP